MESETGTRTGPVTAGLDELTSRSIVGYLRQVGVELDRLWLVAATDGHDDAVRLADASLAVHRALVALAV